MLSKIEMIQTLRSFTNNRAGMADCQKALSEAGGDLEKAKLLLDTLGLVNRPSGLRGVSIQIPDDAPDGWGYIIAKADLYLRLGADTYRKGDALQMPEVSWDEERLEEILSCFRQFVAGKGYRVDNPVENVSISGFSAALRTLHFKKVRQLAVSAEEENNQNDKTVFVDQMLYEHVQGNGSLWLFNKVVYGDDLG
jgi:hypothetical protein